MSIDIERFKESELEQLYYELFPYIFRDFMGRDDCRNVHLPGNIVAPTSGGPVEYTATRGGADTMLQIKRSIYEARARTGQARLRVARETGEY